MIELLNLPQDTEWSIRVIDLKKQQDIASWQPATVLKTASVGKLFLLVEVARAIQAGEVAPTEILQRQPIDIMSYLSLSDALTADSYSVQDWAQWAAMVSDNTATNVLLGRFGLDAVHETTRKLGITESNLLDRVRNERLPGMAPTLSVGSAQDLAGLVEKLYLGTAISAEVSNQLLTWISCNVDTTLVADAFRVDPLEHNVPDRGWQLANKTGTIETARADVGLLTTQDQAIAWAVIANWPDETDPRDQVIDTMRKIGWAIRKYLGG